jgi:hypothetical protein
MPPVDKRADRLAQVTAQVDYHRQRLVLYQRLHGSQPSARLAELEHAYRIARDRLTRTTGGETTESGTHARPRFD